VLVGRLFVLAAEPGVFGDEYVSANCLIAPDYPLISGVAVPANNEVIRAICGMVADRVAQ
jgi:hypothetical protein